ncbi:hypothetical protein DB032_06655 [Chromobacterium sp. Panama]|nr:hypothetical protein DB032_06655 [Chromobacterium sp. Panama]
MECCHETRILLAPKIAAADRSLEWKLRPAKKRELSELNDASHERHVLFPTNVDLTIAIVGIGPAQQRLSLSLSLSLV